MKEKVQIGALVIGFAFLQALSFSYEREQELQVHFLEVGQGDSILIKTPNNQFLLVDGGPGRNVLKEISSKTSYFFSSFDLLILTHPDRDHLEGALSLLNHYEVKRILMTGIVHPSPLYDAFLQTVAERKIPVFIARADQDFQIEEGLTLDILFPTKSLFQKNTEKVNNTSIVALLKYGKTSLLLTGDIEKTIEEELLFSGVDLKSDLLKIPHHGSRTSSTPAFLQASSPDQAIIMAGKNNRYEHPHLDTVLHLDELQIPWVSTKDGGKSFVSNGERWKEL